MQFTKPGARIGLGLAALGRPGYINLGHAADLHSDYAIASMEARAHAVLDAAWAGGVRYFDAARSYGRAEAFLASWLTARNIRSDEVTVGSKWGYTYTAEWQVAADKHEVKDHSLATLLRQAQESMATLGSHLRLYQIHSATLESGVLENRQVLEELARMRAAGLKIGLSVTGPRQADVLRRALDLKIFDCVQATWNLLEPSAGEMLKQAHDAGLGVIVKEALANGRLTPRNDDPDFAAKLQLLSKVASRMQTSVDAFALAAVLAQPWCDIVLSGAAGVEQLTSNLAALTVNWDEHASEVIGSLIEAPEHYWNTRAGLHWN